MTGAGRTVRTRNFGIFLIVFSSPDNKPPNEPPCDPHSRAESHQHTLTHVFMTCFFMPLFRMRKRRANQ